MDSEFPSLKTISLIKTSRLIWNAAFKAKELNLNGIQNDTERKWEFRLLSYRNEAVCNLNAFIKEGRVLTIFKSTLEEYIFALYNNYRNLCLWKMTYDPYNRINMMEDEVLYVSHYFKIDFEFTDNLWVRHFVRNENYDILDRFNIACCFCLEFEIETIWSELKIIYNIDLGNFNFFSFFKENLPLVSYMILEIEYDLAAMENDLGNQNNFWMHAFEYSIKKGYEHAVYYLWQMLFEFEQLTLMENNIYFEFINTGIDFPKDYVSYFLFSQLSEDRRKELVRWTIQNVRVEIWYVLLFSFNLRDTGLYKMGFYEELTIEMIPPLFTLLAEKIWTQQIPLDMEIFEAHWYNLDLERREYILEKGLCLIENLAKGKSINSLGSIIKNLTIKQKWDCLIHNKYEAGISVFDILCKNKEFDMFEKYLYFFLIHTYTYNNATFNILRNDAEIFLKAYLQSRSFKELCEKEGFKANEKELKIRIDCLQTSLTLLSDLCFKCSELVDYSYH